MPILTEDDIYRTSSQFKNWNFTPEKLAAQRLTTNIQATERVKAAVARQRAQHPLKPADSATVSEAENGGSTPVRMEGEVNCLSVAEEKRLVDTFCEKAVELGNFLKFPIEVTATGVQFMRRFYLFNSPMTYDPQTISRSIMFIANKSENHHYTADRYASILPNTTPEMVLAPEFTIVQALRFNFDVRHPFRGLKGGHLEMMEMVKGNGMPLPSMGQTAKTMQSAILSLPRKTGDMGTNVKVEDMEKRITDAYGFTSHILKTSALLTDAYFLYTPSHIWLAAHLLADEPLTLFYLGTKISNTSPLHSKLLNTLRSCAELLSSHRSFNPHVAKEEKEAQDKKEKEEISVLMRKLRQCRDPDKIDLVKLNQAQKRDTIADGELEESKAKRRKLARESHQKEAEEFWGPELPKRENGVGV